MEIVPIVKPNGRNYGVSCMTRTIRNGPKGKELSAKSLYLPSDQPVVCPKDTCRKCKAKGPRNIKCQYIQPTRAQSFAPIRAYQRPVQQMEDNTIYRKSYLPVDGDKPDPILPRHNLRMPNARFSTNTIQKMSYPGWYNQDRTDEIRPCNHDLMGKGPISDETTQKHDYIPKDVNPAAPIFPTHNIFIQDAPFAKQTINKLSYQPVDSNQKREPFVQTASMQWPRGPLENRTTQKMSYQPCKIPMKEFYPWAQKKKYEIPTEKISDDTIYRKSYIPNEGIERTRPILPRKNKNILGDDDKFQSDTIYHMSYPGNDGCHRPAEIRPINNIRLSNQKMENNTTQKMSYIPNPGHRPSEPILPCNHDLLGKGPMQDTTTQKIDYVPKEIDKVSEIRPNQQLFLSNEPLSDKTINRLSYMPPCVDEVVEKILPTNQLIWPSGKIENRTTQKMSYMPVGPIEPMPTPWAEKKPYCAPIHRFADDTCYRMSYDAPGEWVNCDDGGAGDDVCECECPPQDCPCTCPCPPVPVC